MPIIYEPKGRALEYSFLACNHYSGCSHGCWYCYAKDIAAMTGRVFSQAGVRRGAIAQLEREAPKYRGTDKRVLLCFTCDPYQPLDDSERITRRAIEIFRQNEIPFQVLTKGGLRAARDFDLYRKGDAFATTLTHFRAKESSQDEPGAALPADRIEAIELAHEKGIETWVSLEPVLDPLESLAIIAKTHEFVDLYKIGMLNHHKSRADWRQFGATAIGLCEKFSTPYYIKNDLAKYLDGIEFTNTDTRKMIKD